MPLPFEWTSLVLIAKERKADVHMRVRPGAILEADKIIQALVAENLRLAKEAYTWWEAAVQRKPSDGAQTFDPSRPWKAHQHSPGHWSIAREPLPGQGVIEYLRGTGNLNANQAKRLAAVANGVALGEVSDKTCPVCGPTDWGHRKDCPYDRTYGVPGTDGGKKE